MPVGVCLCADVFVHALLARSVSFMGLVSLRWLLLSSNLLNCNLRLGPLQRPLYASCLPCSCSLDALKNTCFAHLQRKLCFCISKKQMLMSKCLWFFKLQIIGSSKPRNWLFHDQMSVSGFVQCFITFSSHVQQEVSLPLQLEDLEKQRNRDKRTPLVSLTASISLIFLFDPLTSSHLI